MEGEKRVLDNLWREFNRNFSGVSVCYMVHDLQYKLIGLARTVVGEGEKRILVHWSRDIFDVRLNK